MPPLSHDVVLHLLELVRDSVTSLFKLMTGRLTQRLPLSAALFVVLLLLKLATSRSVLFGTTNHGIHVASLTASSVNLLQTTLGNKGVSCYIIFCGDISLRPLFLLNLGPLGAATSYVGSPLTSDSFSFLTGSPS